MYDQHFHRQDFVTTIINDVLWLGSIFGMLVFNLVELETIKTIVS